MCKIWNALIGECVRRQWNSFVSGNFAVRQKWHNSTRATDSRCADSMRKSSGKEFKRKYYFEQLRHDTWVAITVCCLLVFYLQWARARATSTLPFHSILSELTFVRTESYHCGARCAYAKRQLDPNGSRARTGGIAFSLDFLPILSKWVSGLPG